MATLNLLKFQAELSKQGADSMLQLYDYAQDGIVKMNVPFFPPVYYLLKPEDVHELLVKQADEAEKVEFVARVARSSFGNGILMSNGALWKRQRKLMQPAFHHAHIKAYAERMIRIAEEHVSNWHDAQIIDLAHEMHQLTLRIVVDMLFSSDVRSTMDAIQAAIEDIGAGFAAQAGNLLLAMLPDWFPAPALIRKQRGAKNFHRILDGLISERRKLGEENSPHDLLTALMFSKDSETGETMDDEQLRGELLTLYIAGHDTTAWLLSWALNFLEQNPHAKERFHNELESLNGRTPTVDDLGNLPYGKMILQETLRLRPPAWFIQRQAHQAMEINGKKFPAKSIFMIVQYALHHNEEIFPDAKAFKPERWENDAEKALPKGAYIPFATGPRVCIGNGFAMMEAQLILSFLMQKFKMKALGKAEIIKGSNVILGFDKPINFELFKNL